MSTATRSWSVQQVAIFNFFARGQGNLVVRARAGTGKTTTIVQAVSHAPASEKILLAAFNKRIATELDQKVTSSNTEVKTLHALGFAFIRRQWSAVKIDAAVEFDRAAKVCGEIPPAIISLVAKIAGLLKNIAPFGGVVTAEQIAVDFDCEPEQEWVEEGWTTARIAEYAVQARNAAKVRDAAGRISFDDMIYIPLALGFVRPWFTMVVIDEAQDMNAAQLLLAMKSCKPSGRIVVVGDDRQAIYGFRGADSNGLDRLKTELKATELGLTVTYRCGKLIVDSARTLVADYEAAPTAHDGVIDSLPVEALVDHAAPGDFILSRANAPLMGICLKLLRKGVPARIEGRDVAAGLKAIIKNIRAKSVPDFMKRVEGWKTRQLKRYSAEMTAKRDQVEDQAACLTAVAEGCASVTEITARLDSLFGDSDGNVPSNKVVCSSIHKSKGLEADRVFILGDTIKLRSQEEQNIAYVAITRARAHLTWVGRRAV